TWWPPCWRGTYAPAPPWSSPVTAASWWDGWLIRCWRWAMSVPLTPGERISTVRRLYRGRPPTSPELGTTADPSSPSSVCGKRAGRRRRGGEAAYLAYLVVLILALVVVPLLLGIASVLA